MAPTVAVVGGAGTVGATAAYSLSTAHGIDVRLVDIDENLSNAQAMDIAHANAHATHPVGVGQPSGRVEAVSPGVEALDGVDCIVVTASIERPSTDARNMSRRAFLEGNLDVMDDVGEWMGEAEPRPVVVLSNPADQLTYRLYEATGWPRHRFVGYSLSETARLAAIVGEREGVPPEAVSIPILGEHGEHMVPAFSRATVDGEPYRPPADVREELMRATKDAPYDIIEHRGHEESSRWVSGRGLALLTRAIVSGGVEEPICLSTPLDGEYGHEGVSISVPVTLDADGIAKIHEWALSEEERSALTAAAESVRTTVSE